MAPIEEDTQVYKLYLLKNSTADISYIRLVSQITGDNLLQTKIKVSSRDFLGLEGAATEIQKIKRQLEEQNVLFYITPEFIY